MRRFRAVLLKPLDQQADRDGDLIDPAGVQFDPEEEHLIWDNFGYRVPEDVLGHGRIHRAEDGSLVVEGELEEALVRRDIDPKSLAIGIITPSGHVPGQVYESCRFMSMALTGKHADPTQPVITFEEEAP